MRPMDMAVLLNITLVLAMMSQHEAQGRAPLPPNNAEKTPPYTQQQAIAAVLMPYRKVKNNRLFKPLTITNNDNVLSGYKNGYLMLNTSTSVMAF